MLSLAGRCRGRGVRLERGEDVVLWPSTSEGLPAMLYFLAEDPRFEQNEANHDESVLSLIALLS